MRARAVLTVLTLMPMLLGAQQGGRNQDTRPGIAVLPFNNGGSYGQGKEDFDALERGIAGMMISELSQNPAARLVERQEVQRLVDEQNLGAQGRVDPQTASKIGKLVGARYMVMGTFVDFYGDFRVDVRLINTETGEVVKTESERMQRDHMFDIIRSIATRLMKDANLPALQRGTGGASEQRMGRQVPTEALTYYSRALLYTDHGQKDKAVEMFNRALVIFPGFTEAEEGLQKAKSS
jgi:TolB-like protein